MTGRTEVGRASFQLRQLASDGTTDVWLPVESSMPGAARCAALRCAALCRGMLLREAESLLCCCCPSLLRRLVRAHSCCRHQARPPLSIARL